ncbi:MAG TPA: glycosyltransferase family 39 protein [Oligoflexia bacterium]|nr:glycosyltransferase family 39 protein [Oligoflexia bacterium]HMP47815.1 glycosyltransferase family 39 protein [Oligoflexia bacterium]
MRSLSLLLAISLIWIIGLFSLGELLEVFEVSEAREGVVVREILDYGTTLRSYLLPLRHGQVVPSKPPLYHWITASICRLTGEFTEFELRLVSLLSAISIIWLLYFFLCAFCLSRVALCSAAILGTSYGFLQMSLDGRVDMLFSLFVASSHLLLSKHLLQKPMEAPDSKTLYLIGILVTFSVLSKGPLGIVLFVLFGAPAIYYQGGFGLLKSWFINFQVLITLLLSSLWYLTASLIGPEGVLSKHLIFENISRFFGGGDIPTKPFWYYFVYIWTQFAPWSFIILIVYAVFYYQEKKLMPAFTKAEIGILRLFSLQLLTVILFISLSSGKRRAYLLPLLPLLSANGAIILCRLVAEWLQDYLLIGEKAVRYIRLTSISLLIMSILISLFSFVANTLNLDPRSFSGSLIKGFVSGDPFSFFMLTLISACFLIMLILVSRFYGGLTKIFGLIILINLQAYISVGGVFYLTKGESHGYKSFAEQVLNWQKDLETENKSEIRLTFIKEVKDESFDTFFFYMNKRIYLHTVGFPETPGFYLARRSWINSLSPDQRKFIREEFEGGRRKDTSEQYIVLFERIPNHLSTQIDNEALT